MKTTNAAANKFRRLLLRFDRLSQLHYAFKTQAYTMISCGTSAAADLQTHPYRYLINGVRIPHVHCMAVLHNHRQTSLKTTSRTGDLPNFD
jgi:hypothetical protein